MLNEPSLDMGPRYSYENAMGGVVKHISPSHDILTLKLCNFLKSSLFNNCRANFGREDERPFILSMSI